MSGRVSDPVHSLVKTMRGVDEPVAKRKKKINVSPGQSITIHSARSQNAVDLSEEIVNQEADR